MFPNLHTRGSIPHLRYPRFMLVGPLLALGSHLLCTFYAFSCTFLFPIARPLRNGILLLPSGIRSLVSFGDTQRQITFPNFVRNCNIVRNSHFLATLRLRRWMTLTESTFGGRWDRFSRLTSMMAWSRCALSTVRWSSRAQAAILSKRCSVGNGTALTTSIAPSREFRLWKRFRKYWETFPAKGSFW